MFDRIFAALAGQSPKTSTYHNRCPPSRSTPHSSQPCLKRGCSPPYWTHQRKFEFKKFHTVCDQDGKPICLLLSEGEMSDYKSAALLLPVLPDAQELIADKGYEADCFRQALLDRKIQPCIPPRKGRTTTIFFDKTTYKLRLKIENLFAKT